MGAYFLCHFPGVATGAPPFCAWETPAGQKSIVVTLPSWDLDTDCTFEYLQFKIIA